MARICRRGSGRRTPPRSPRSASGRPGSARSTGRCDRYPVDARNLLPRRSRWSRTVPRKPGGCRPSSTRPPGRGSSGPASSPPRWSPMLRRSRCRRCRPVHLRPRRTRRGPDGTRRRPWCGRTCCRPVPPALRGRHPTGAPVRRRWGGLGLQVESRVSSLMRSRRRKPSGRHRQRPHGSSVPSIRGRLRVAFHRLNCDAPALSVVTSSVSLEGSIVFSKGCAMDAAVEDLTELDDHDLLAGGVAEGVAEARAGAAGGRGCSSSTAGARPKPGPGVPLPARGRSPRVRRR